MDVYTDQNPSWMHWIAPEEFNDSELFKIVVFYVFHSPCVGLSSMRRSLEEYGWSDPWKKPYYLNKQLLAASTNPKLIVSSRTYDAMEKALQKADLLDDFPSDYSKERICIKDCQKNQFMSVFNHLRNAFAHCRLNMVDDNGECVFILEDVVSKNNAPKVKVSARMILRKTTLLKWIDIIEGGEKEWKSSEKK
ncbi:MAG: hypothetical protein LUD07_02650 [Clostridiales bacterium]|nr:hypothetical protein [Clostridiales bacterium]